MNKRRGTNGKEKQQSYQTLTSCEWAPCPQRQGGISPTSTRSVGRAFLRGLERSTPAMDGGPKEAKLCQEWLTPVDVFFLGFIAGLDLLILFL